MAQIGCQKGQQKDSFRCFCDFQFPHITYKSPFSLWGLFTDTFLTRSKPFSSTNMVRPQRRYRGVRQRHWGSWVSEICHPQSKTRIWLGTFETAEDAARAYDEASRLICGPKARTNFPYDPNAARSKLLSATLTAKLHKCRMASIQKLTALDVAASKDITAKKKETGRNWVVKKCEVDRGTHELKLLEDDDIEQMIEELRDYSSMELCSPGWSASSSAMPAV